MVRLNLFQLAKLFKEEVTADWSATMVVETENIKLPVYDAEDGYISDSEAFASVISVLDGVRMVKIHTFLLCTSFHKYLLEL